MICFGRNVPWSSWDVRPGIRHIEVGVGTRTYPLIEGAESVHHFGHWLWLGGVLLARELDTLDLAGKTVLDLGAGTGLIGIVAAKLGAKVTWCDKHTGERIRDNAELNGVKGTIIPQEWGTLRGRWDWAFGGEADRGPAQLLHLAANHLLIDTDNLPGWQPIYVKRHGYEVAYYRKIYVSPGKD